MPNKLAPSYVQHTFPLRFDSVARRFSERRPLRDSGSVALASSVPFLPCLSFHAFPPMPFLQDADGRSFWQIIDMGFWIKYSTHEAAEPLVVQSIVNLQVGHSCPTVLVTGRSAHPTDKNKAD